MAVQGFVNPSQAPQENEPIEVKWARDLANALRAKRKLQRPVDLNKWKGAFQSLAKLESKETITQTLQWYVQNLDKEFVPQAYSARSFKEKFPAIIKAAQRDAVQPAQVEVSKVAQEIAEHLALKLWPKGSASQLPNVVQRSLTNYHNLLKEMTKRLRRLEDLTLHGKFKTIQERMAVVRLRGLMRFLLDGKLHTPHNFVILWFLDVQASVIRWADWNGSLERYVFDLDNPRFTQDMSNACYEYTHDHRSWTRLLEYIKSEGK